MSPSSASLRTRPKEHQFVSDLESLFRRLRVPIGSPECLEGLGPLLATKSALRSDLFTLCGAISRMSDSDLAPEELLSLVGRAVGGRAVGSADEGEPYVPEVARSVFLSGYREWQNRSNSLVPNEFDDADLEPKARKFSAAAVQRLRHAATDWNVPLQESPADITPSTRIGDLTISELRAYLDDIEQRVGRLQPYLASIRAELPGAEAVMVAVAKAAEPAEVPDYLPGAAEPAAPSADAGMGGHGVCEGELPTEVLVEQAAAKAEPESAPLIADAKVQTPAQDDSGKEDDELILPLRATLVRKEEFEPTLFRSVSGPERNRSRGFAWTAAVLALLLPAAWYGRKLLLPPPARLEIVAPAPPVSPPAEPPAPLPKPAVATVPRLPTGTLAKSRTSYTSHLDPGAVRMEAQAARAEKQDANSPR